MAALQNGVSRIGEPWGTGRFLQVAGLRYTYNPNRAAGPRILRAEALTRQGYFIIIIIIIIIILFGKIFISLKGRIELG
jgi:hypothetical protein